MTFLLHFLLYRSYLREKGLVWDYLKEMSGTEVRETRHTQVLREEAFLFTVILPLQELFSTDLALFLYPFHTRLWNRPEQGEARWEEQDSGCLVWLQATLCRKFMKMPQSFESAV